MTAENFEPPEGSAHDASRMDDHGGIQEPGGDRERSTLEPPGTIAVVGAGPLGIEAALYGRFLGYDVTLFERSAVGGAISDRLEQPLPLPSSRCWSPLAASALEAQFPERFPGKGPETVREWLESGLIALTETDLLRGRLQMPATVTRIELLEVTGDQVAGDGADDERDGGPVAPDFRLTVQDDSGANSSRDFEAVILAIGVGEPPELAFELPRSYFFRIGAEPGLEAEQSLVRGLRGIVTLFAELADRAELDLYRPLRR